MKRGKEEALENEQQFVQITWKPVKKSELD